MAATRLPPSTKRTAGKISPSWNSSVHCALSVPGKRPPMSMWWAIEPLHATSSPPEKHGMNTCRSGVCVPPMYGWLVMNASSGSIRPLHLAITASRANCISPSCAGICSELAIARPSAAKMPQLKSSISRMIGE